MRERATLRQVGRALRRAGVDRDILRDDDAVWLMYEKIAKDQGCCNAAGAIDDWLDALSKVLKWINEHKAEIEELVAWVREMLGL